MYHMAPHIREGRLDAPEHNKLSEDRLPTTNPLGLNFWLVEQFNVLFITKVPGMAFT